jgi:hypothetical protein
MPRTPPTKPRRKRGTAASPRITKAELSPLQQDFADKLRACTAMERKFVVFRLKRKTGKEAAILAGYAPKQADSQAAQLSGRLRVAEAYEAGLRAAGFGPLEILDDIGALRAFDRSQIEREIQVPVVVHVQRRAEDVVGELITRERAVAEFLQGCKASEEVDEAAAKQIQRRLNTLLMQRLALQEQLALDPDVMTVTEVTQLVTKRVIDYDLARERGLLRFIKGVKPGPHGEVIELHDWVTGVDMAAKTQGLFKERHELTGKDGQDLPAATVFVLPSNGRGDA